MPQLPQQWNNSTAQASLAPVVSSPEYYIPLWWYSGGIANSYDTSQLSRIQKGSTSVASGSVLSSQKLHTLSSLWSGSTKFAFEATIYNSSASSIVYAVLRDITAGVNLATIGATASTATLVRSSLFNAVPGNVLSVYLYSNAGNSYLTDASLIVFPS